MVSPSSAQATPFCIMYAPSCTNDVLQPVEDVTENPRPELRVLGVIAKTDGGSLVLEAGHLAITVNRGYRANGTVMPSNRRSVDNGQELAGFCGHAAQRATRTDER